MSVDEFQPTKSPYAPALPPPSFPLSLSLSFCHGDITFISLYDASPIMWTSPLYHYMMPLMKFS